jgi:oligopeptide transport system substrate-binding protein
MNQKFFESVGGTDGYGKSPETMIANGAFKITNYQPSGTTIELAKNADYYNADAVKLDGLKYQIISDSQQAMMEFSSGGLDVTYLSGEQVDLYQEDPQFLNIMEGYLWFISPNTKVKGLDNVNVRKALGYAIDKKALIDNVLKDGSVVADFVVPIDLATGPTGNDFRTDAGIFPGYDVAAAQAAWETAKQELGVDKLTFKLILENTDSSIKAAQAIQADIQKNLPGITLELEQMQKSTRLDKQRSGDFELSLTRWGPDYADPMTFMDMWITDGNNNFGFWSNAQYDADILSAQKGDLAKNPDLRWKQLQDSEKIIMDDMVILPLYQQGRALMVKTGVSGIEYHSAGINRVYTNASKAQ